MPFLFLLWKRFLKRGFGGKLLVQCMCSRNNSVSCLLLSSSTKLIRQVGLCLTLLLPFCTLSLSLIPSVVVSCVTSPWLTLCPFKTWWGWVQGCWAPGLSTCWVSRHADVELPVVSVSGHPEIVTNTSMGTWHLDTVQGLLIFSLSCWKADAQLPSKHGVCKSHIQQCASGSTPGHFFEVNWQLDTRCWCVWQCILTMNCETSRNHSLLRKQVHTWVALRTVVRGTLIDSTQPHIQALREGYQQGVPGFFYNDGMDAAVWCAGALNYPETGRLCEMQSWVHYSVVASAVIDGGCCWAQESAPKVNCGLCYR